MSDIKTVYRGHVIRYNDNSEEWYCSDIEGKGYSNEKLSRLKAAIDKMYLDRRKKVSIRVLEIGHGGHGRYSELTDAIIIEYLGAIYSRNYRTGVNEFDYHKVAVSAKRDRTDKLTRQEKRLSDLADDTPEVRAAYEEYTRVFNEAQELYRKAEGLREAIPRLTIDAILELVQIKTGGNADDVGRDA